MIINNGKFDLSLNDTSNLRQLILENPDLPLLIFAGEEAWGGNFPYEQTQASNGAITTLTLYDGYWVDEDDYRDRLSDDWCYDYPDMSDEEFNELIDQKIAHTEFVKAIVVYVG